MSADILIIDDEADIRDLISGILEDEGYEARSAGNSDDCLAAVLHRRPTLIILDIWLRGSNLDGIEILQELKKNHPQIPVVMISGHGNIETAVSAIKLGAYDFIEKPFKSDRLLHVVARALEATRLKRENEELIRKSGGKSRELITKSSAMLQLRQSLDKIAPTRSRVLITGGAGVGKEVVARLIHELSPRANAPFMILNCATMAPERLEIELFGVEDDKMSGNKNSRFGILEQAHGGTLFLDEIADMPMETQGKILRVLVDQSFQRVGGSEKIKVDVRVISSSCEDLDTVRAEGRLREDLYHRLNVVPLTVPPLSERPEDIAPLARHFIRTFAENSGIPDKKIGEDAIAVLQSSNWPGNVRQLKNIVENTMILSKGDDGEVISADMIPREQNAGAASNRKNDFNMEIMTLPLREARERFERQYLETQISRFSGNISRTASFIGMERSALHRKLKSLGVHNGDKVKAAEGE